MAWTFGLVEELGAEEWAWALNLAEVLWAEDVVFAWRVVYSAFALWVVGMALSWRVGCLLVLRVARCVLFGWFVCLSYVVLR